MTDAAQAAYLSRLADRARAIQLASSGPAAMQAYVRYCALKDRVAALRGMPMGGQGEVEP